MDSATPFEQDFSPVNGSEELLSRSDGSVLWVKLNRPSVLNALTQNMVDTLIDVIAAARIRKGVRVIVLYGEGRAFCVGTDLNESRLRGATPGANAAYVHALHRLMETIERCPCPVIAAVNGVAAAGGLELMLACDLAYAAISAKLGDAHSNYAMFPGGGATLRLGRRISVAKVKHLMFTGDLISANDAATAGLVDVVLPDDQLLAAVRGLACRLAGKSPLLLERMKDALHNALEQSAAAALAHERALYMLHVGSEDRAEGIAAFLEKRAPEFKGA